VSVELHYVVKETENGSLAAQPVRTTALAGLDLLPPSPSGYGGMSVRLVLRFGQSLPRPGRG